MVLRVCQRILVEHQEISVLPCLERSKIILLVSNRYISSRGHESLHRLHPSLDRRLDPQYVTCAQRRWLVHLARQTAAEYRVRIRVGSAQAAVGSQEESRAGVDQFSIACILGPDHRSQG